MKWWYKLSHKAKFYTFSFIDMMFVWAILFLAGASFINVVFFLTAFVWHVALTTPGLKEKVMTNHHKLSFLAVVVRINHYLQIFINIKRIPHSSSVIRAVSPVLFTTLLFILGGNGNIFFTILGSFCFEVVYILLKTRTTFLMEVNPLAHINDLEIPPTIPSAEKTHE